MDSLSQRLSKVVKTIDSIKLNQHQSFLNCYHFQEIKNFSWSRVIAQAMQELHFVLNSAMPEVMNTKHKKYVK